MSARINQQQSPAYAAASEPQWAPLPGSGLRELGIAILWALLVIAPIAGISGGAIYSDWSQKRAAELAIAEAALAHERLVAAEPGPMLPVKPTAHGRDIFATVCIACHGADGTGVPGLGKNLTVSDFVALQSDESFHDFLVTGRPDAKPVPMPPRAGRPDLTDEDLRAVVAYVRGLQDPRRMPELPPMVFTASAPTDAETAAALEAAGGDEDLAFYIANGTKLFSTICIACHGPGGIGIAGNGKALVNNAFIQSQDDDSLLAFIQRGRDSGDAANTTGVSMPPKGGNPALSEDDLLDVICYLRTLQPKDARAAAGKN